MIRYGIPGQTGEYYCEIVDQKPSEGVEMLTKAPTDGKRYLAKADGTSTPILPKISLPFPYKKKRSLAAFLSPSREVYSLIKVLS